MRRRIDPALTARARELRNNPTETELAVWHLISRYRPSFTRQCVEAPFIIDLACRQAKLAIEFDGSQHIGNAESDARRSTYLRSKGWRVIRFWNSDVLVNPEGVVRHILAQAAECLGGTHPQPLPSREGRERRPRSR
ncbi:endonuclease domain-containing protein [Sphingomonas sp. JC676]|nr:endonuclease domain-containing protein [Sphingomonas sp. JC676]